MPLETVCYADWAAQGFPGIKLGDTILTSKPGHWLTWGIIIVTSIKLRKAVTWRHAMRYAGDGMAWSQEKVMRLAPLSDWKGQLIRVYSNPAYTDEDRQCLVDQAAIKEGRAYDGLGSFVGQVARLVPFAGNWLGGLIQVSSLNYCSEGHCEDEKSCNLEFRKGESCAISPAETNMECKRLGYKCLTFRLV